MDETAIWNYAPLCQTYVPFDLPGYVQTPDVDHRDTLVVGIVGDGRKLLLYFIESKPAKRKNKQVIEKPVKGMTVEIMIKWIKDIFIPNREEVKCLILDKASSHTSRITKAFAEENNIQILYLPAKTAADLSPLDNGFFSQMKALLKGYPLGTIEQKKETLELIVKDIQRETIQKYFIKCGLCYIEDYIGDDFSEEENPL